jgi:hypothetical protein
MLCDAFGVEPSPHCFVVPHLLNARKANARREDFARRFGFEILVPIVEYGRTVPRRLLYNYRNVPKVQSVLSR